ncbi:MAG: hypothetical protein JWQ71_2500, partial [Pedosphaera sp.]|nr:hypothetical protein [Pedosphaera sp.]
FSIEHHDVGLLLLAGTCDNHLLVGNGIDCDRRGPWAGKLGKDFRFPLAADGITDEPI